MDEERVVIVMSKDAFNKLMARNLDAEIVFHMQALKPDEQVVIKPVNAIIRQGE